MSAPNTASTETIKPPRPAVPVDNVKGAGKAAGKANRPLRVRIQIALRNLHIYSSMATLLLILFFALSGLLLNNPQWLPDGPQNTTEYHGKVNKAWLGDAQGQNTNWLQIAEQVRADHDLRGRAGEFQNDGEEATFSFLAAGRETQVTLSDQTGEYKVSENSQGVLNLLGDLHRGRHTGTGWNWVINLTASFLTFIALSGFGILLYLKKLRRPALITLVAGGLAALGAVYWLS